jgi:hypothetical protein
MKWYNICTDETEDRSFWFVAYSRMMQFLHHDFKRYCWYSVALPTAKVCQVCVHNASLTLHAYGQERRRTRYLAKRAKET